MGELDTRGEHYYFMRYWVDRLSSQQDDISIKEEFEKIKNKFDENEDKIIEELLSVQGQKTDIKGYYRPDKDIVKRLMRPSATLNEIVDEI